MDIFIIAVVVIIFSLFCICDVLKRNLLSS